MPHKAHESQPGFLGNAREDRTGLQGEEKAIERIFVGNEMPLNLIFYILHSNMSDIIYHFFKK